MTKIRLNLLCWLT